MHESTGNDVWFAGNGLMLAVPWHVVQSLYVSPSIGCGMAAGPPAWPPVSSPRPASGVGPGRWQTVHDSFGRPAWSAGNGFIPFGPWHVSHCSWPLIGCGISAAATCVTLGPGVGVSGVKTSWRSIGAGSVAIAVCSKVANW